MYIYIYIYIHKGGMFVLKTKQHLFSPMSTYSTMPEP